MLFSANTDPSYLQTGCLPCNKETPGSDELGCVGSPHVAIFSQERGTLPSDVDTVLADANRLSKTFLHVPCEFFSSGRKLCPRLGIVSGLKMTSDVLGTRDNLALHTESTSRKSLESFINFTLS